MTIKIATNDYWEINKNDSSPMVIRNKNENQSY